MIFTMQLLRCRFSQSRLFHVNLFYFVQQKIWKKINTKWQTMQISGKTVPYELSHMNLHCLLKPLIAFDSVYFNNHKTRIALVHVISFVILFFKILAIRVIFKNRPQIENLKSEKRFKSLWLLKLNHRNSFFIYLPFKGVPITSNQRYIDK